ncbi:MAG: DUF4160 domain-containing protein [bacterium]|nr:DUF4160 domain-containing protein [bacterium]
MPEIFRTAGFVFFFYTNEGHEPLHVHVRHAGGHAKFWMEPIALDYSEGMKTNEVSRAKQLLLANQRMILEKWHEIHGA